MSRSSGGGLRQRCRPTRSSGETERVKTLCDARRDAVPAPDHRAQECLDALDDHLAPVEQHLADANDAGEQQRHVEMDERRRPMDPGDGAKARRRTASSPPPRRSPAPGRGRSAQPPAGARWRRAGFRPSIDASARWRTRHRRARYGASRRPRGRGGGSASARPVASRNAKSGAEHHENRAHREHVRVHGVGHRRDHPRGPPDAQVFQRVADEQPDKREEHAARRGNPRSAVAGSRREHTPGRYGRHRSPTPRAIIGAAQTLADTGTR